jgi:hypothetical protein
MPEAERTVLVHLNVSVPADDARSADEIGTVILSALEVGSDADEVRNLDLSVVLVEEV